MNRSQKKYVERLESQGKIWVVELQVFYGGVDDETPDKRYLTIEADTHTSALSTIKEYADNHNFAWFFIEDLSLFKGDVGVIHASAN